MSRTGSVTDGFSASTFCAALSPPGLTFSPRLHRLALDRRSGAIAGVLGAYVMFFPRARVMTFLPLGFFYRIVKIPAVWFLGFSFLTQFLSGALAPATAAAAGGGVAWWAHVGGFACGLLIAAVAGPAKADCGNG